MDHASLGNDLIDVFAGGHFDNSTSSWLGQRYETMRTTLSTQAANFFDGAQKMFTIISSSDAVQLMRNLTTKSDSTWNDHNITRLTTVPELQTAGLVNQRWIMANPTVRQVYLDGGISGYAGSYENFGGDAIGENHFDYRLVMDGIVTHDEKSYGFKTYYQAMPEGERELTIHEKADINASWNAIVGAVEAHEEDPTCPHGNMMG